MKKQQKVEPKQKGNEIGDRKEAENNPKKVSVLKYMGVGAGIGALAGGVAGAAVGGVLLGWNPAVMGIFGGIGAFVGAVIGGIVGAIVACCKNKPPKMMGINDTNINNEYDYKAYDYKAKVELFSDK